MHILFCVNNIKFGTKCFVKVEQFVLPFIQWLGSIAASLLLLFSVGMYLYKPSAPKDTCATPEEAYMQAQKALVMLSSRLNKGMEEVETVQEATGKIRENVYEQLNRINNTKQ